MILPDGTVTFDSPKLNVTPQTTRDEFLASPLFPISKKWHQDPPWSRYIFQEVTFHGELFCGEINFCSDTVSFLDLCSSRPEFGTSWNDYSGVKERACHCFHKQLLQQIFARPPDVNIPQGSDERDADIVFKFPWGSAAARTDSKSGGCGIFIRYGD